MKLKLLPLGILAAFAIAAVAGMNWTSEAHAQVPPPVPTQTGTAGQGGAPPGIPSLFLGTIRAGGQPVPDGFEVVARIDDRYESEPVVIRNGRYDVIKVAPPNNSGLAGRTITFHISEVRAEQTAIFTPSSVNNNFNLTFPSLPVATPTPAFPPAVYNGQIVIAGGTVPLTARLTARVGNYESSPAAVQGQNYINLVLSPGDISFAGMPVEFYMNGIKSSDPVPAVFFNPGAFQTVNLIFLQQPPELPTATPTAAPPTETPLPTETPVPPTETPTNTATATATATRTATRVPPTITPTPIPPTPTRVVLQVTATSTRTPAAPSPTPTPEPSGGACGSTLGQGSPIAGLGHLMFLLAPVAILGGIKIRRRGR